MKAKIYLILVLIILGINTNLFAHPNSILNYRLFFKFDNNKVTDIGESWIFDKVTSQILISKYNIKSTGKLRKKDSIKIGEKLMEELSSARNFTYILVDEKDLGKIKTSGFNIEIDDGIFSIAFNNHLPSPIDVTKNTLIVEIKDVDFTIITNLVEKNPIILLGASKENCKIDTKLIYPNFKDFYDVSMITPYNQVKLKCEDR